VSFAVTTLCVASQRVFIVVVVVVDDDDDDDDDDDFVIDSVLKRFDTPTYVYIHYDDDYDGDKFRDKVSFITPQLCWILVIF
jgi:hypothetical protein